jgi:alkylated DNA repair dioxygenase AlkB
MQLLAIDGAEIYYEPSFLAPKDARNVFSELLKHCAWQRRTTSFGSPVPRDEAYYGDPESRYVYSRREYRPLPWIPVLWSLKSRVEQSIPVAAYNNLQLPPVGFNAVLCNLYRNGSDSVGLHADAEPEMGPVIASVSVGAERIFRLKRKDGVVAFAERLPSGSLLVMAGQTQKHFKHEVPKEPHITEPRINLTFRHIEQVIRRPGFRQK